MFPHAQNFFWTLGRSDLPGSLTEKGWTRKTKSVPLGYNTYYIRIVRYTFPPLHKIAQSPSNWSDLLGEHTLIVYYLDSCPLENCALFSGGPEGASSCDSTLRFLESEETETVKDFWTSLDWKGLVLVAKGVDLPCPLPHPPGFLKPFLSLKLLPRPTYGRVE